MALPRIREFSQFTGLSRRHWRAAKVSHCDSGLVTRPSLLGLALYLFVSRSIENETGARAGFPGRTDTMRDDIQLAAA